MRKRMLQGVWLEHAALPPSPSRPMREQKMPEESDINNTPTATLHRLKVAATAMELGLG